MKEEKCNGKCRPTVMQYDSGCPVHGWGEENPEHGRRFTAKDLSDCWDRAYSAGSSGRPGIPKIVYFKEKFNIDI